MQDVVVGRLAMNLHMKFTVTIMPSMPVLSVGLGMSSMAVILSLSGCTPCAESLMRRKIIFLSSKLAIAFVEFQSIPLYPLQHCHQPLILLLD